MTEKNTGSSTRVLIIDDDPLLREFLAKILRQYHISSVRQTGSILMASDVLRRNKIDLVFLDIQLDGESGLESLAELSRLSPSTDFVMVSAHSSFDNLKLALENGAKSFVVKPFTSKKIGGVLSTLKYIKPVKKD